MAKVIGIDLGGTKITGAVINARGEIIDSLTIATEAQQGRVAVIQRICNLITHLAQREEEAIAAVGIGTPGYVDVEEGVVVYYKGRLVDWCQVPLRATLEEALPYPVVVENDANMAALGESWLGAGRNLESFIMITLGTGVGGAFYRRSEGLWHGHQWCGGEIGHMILYPEGKTCSCGQVGCAENYLSGTAISQHYYDLTGKVMSSEEVFRAAIQGNDLALKVINQFAHDLAILITTLKSMLDPQAFLISGGLIDARHFWWPLLEKELKAVCPQADKVAIRPAANLNQAGCLGAARLALAYLESRKQDAVNY